MLVDTPLLIGGAAVTVLAVLGGLLAVVRSWRRRARSSRGAPGEPATPWVSGLAKTRGSLTRRILESWRGATEADAWLAEVEEILLTSDVGVAATRLLTDRLRGRMGDVADAAALRDVLRTEMRALLSDDRGPADHPKPEVILVVGVNGVGKTTTIGKLAQRYRQQGRQVLLVAADTFRAAATEQLTLWAERVGADLVKHQHGADPSAVAFDGVKAAQARGTDIVIIDTAGRLHVKANLMEELKKIARTIGRQLPGAPHQVLLVIDATTGQNALNQARVFHEAIPVTGVVLSKLDGTAKGGVALAIRQELGLSIRYVGLGERPDDLAVFDPDSFLEALFAEIQDTAAA